uniref:Uncharacterized protein n=1 Tax=Siphoviridae sp. ct2vX3 TaxID=2825318 RepID=A0A8S5PYR1_9CAUD|nr:MAG TPA: hypothetical protein [Siphoviridae sp. ct2vX3]
MNGYRMKISIEQWVTKFLSLFRKSTHKICKYNI